MQLDWISPQQAAKKWGITKRQAQSLCAQGMIAGAIRISRVWLIPKNAPKPLDRRTKEAKNL